MKLCIECKHIRIPDNGIKYARCDLTQTATTDPVSGEKSIEREYCHTMRTSKVEGRCGMGAIHFEAKVTDTAAEVTP
ncbi:hypothetical protein UFOVP154_3 [uncultured Caudovirales phage]|uniref:Uncharacterized protein n=1 Tax=uncultured Caudovirales phage TaxID=2100421 RepID=A0A6J7WBV8_9CAUD|nr:hypothetical protein UFOVP8_52 [uncultured Caudovirales phage]CAB5170109.1 hypothetical protein UFOVP154_3 [uncultured Caudovirales phage]